MSLRENILKAARFERPDYIPLLMHVNPSCWQHYPQSQLQDLMESHPRLFPNFKRRPEPIVPEFLLCARADEPYTDDWGCLWKTSEDGVTGTVVEHPLADWSNFDDFKAPDPEICTGVGPINWEKAYEGMKTAISRDVVAAGGLQHGHTFLRLSDLRGYQNLMYDMMDEEPRLMQLIEMVEEFNMVFIKRYIDAGAEYMKYPEDLGMQIGPMISPDLFKKYISPSYKRLIAPARDAGCVIHMHSDGDIRMLINNLLEDGVGVINLQDTVNGIDWIKENLTGRVCVDLDIDRQNITVNGTPQQIDSYIRDAVTKLGSREGGLMFVYGLYPGIPMENVKALMDAMEKYSLHYS